MKLLAIETATEACSVAVWCDGAVRERFEIAPRRHAELVLPWCDALLADAGITRGQLDAIAVGRGPGAFTGVRLAIAVAQGIALALDLPVLAVSTLRVLAAGGDVPNDDGVLAAGDIANGARVLAAIDARMGEVYWGCFQRAGEACIPLGGEGIAAPAEVTLQGDGWHGVGTGFAAQDGALAARLSAQLASVDAQAVPRAGALARLAVQDHAAGLALPAERIEPAYLRNNVALTLAEQAALRAGRDGGR